MRRHRKNEIAKEFVATIKERYSKAKIERAKPIEDEDLYFVIHVPSSLELEASEFVSRLTSTVP